MRTEDHVGVVVEVRHRTRAPRAHHCIDLLQYAEASAGRDTPLGRRIAGLFEQLDGAVLDGVDISRESVGLCWALAWEADAASEWRAS